MEIKAPKGTKDILPAESGAWDRFFEATDAVFRSYGYGRIDTPIFESESLFVKAIGSATDIVNKEMYTFEDKGGRMMSLRPEQTAGVVRAYIEHGIHRTEPLFKAFYRGPMFRYERPQGGRQRQFWQIGAEALGSGNPVLDAEVIGMAVEALSAAGLADLKLAVNSVGCGKCRPAYSAALRDFILSAGDDFCPTCLERAKTNPLRTFDCKNPGCREALQNAPLITDSLCEDCRTHHDSVLRCLDSLSVQYVSDPRLVRGLDYYAKTVFELTSGKLGAQDAVAAGGRYDGLVAKYSGPDVPGIGFAAGVERILLALAAKDDINDSKGPDVYVAAMGEPAALAGLTAAKSLRKAGMTVCADFSDKPLKKQLSNADKARARYVLIIGEDELATGAVTIRDMANGNQAAGKMEAAAAIIDDLKAQGEEG
jgi:histidyl-tRNA synthetase